MKITLPYPPTTNHLYITRGKFRVPSPQAKAYKADVVKRCQIARIRPIDGNVAISLHVYRPRKVGDLDNTFKVVLDSLKGYAWHDDKQVIEIHGKRFDDKHDPRVEVDITEV